MLTYKIAAANLGKIYLWNYIYNQSLLVEVPKKENLKKYWIGNSGKFISDEWIIED